jgi:hypothetical protein
MSAVQEILKTKMCRDTAGLVLDYLVGDKDYWKGKNSSVLVEVPLKMDISVKHNIRNALNDIREEGDDEEEVIEELQRMIKSGSFNISCDHYYLSEGSCLDFYFKFLLNGATNNIVKGEWIMSDKFYEEAGIKKYIVKFYIEEMRLEEIEKKRKIKLAEDIERNRQQMIIFNQKQRNRVFNIR